MNKHHFLPYYFFNMPLCALEHLSTEKSNTLLDHIKQIYFCFEHSYSGLAGRSYRRFIKKHTEKIEEIFNNSQIPLPLPQERTLGWLTDVKTQLQATLNSHNDLEDKECSIQGLNKALLVQALFNSASPNEGASADTSITQEECESLLKETQNITALKGRTLKINVTGDVLDTRSYNGVNGEGLAQLIIQSLRNEL